MRVTFKEEKELPPLQLTLPVLRAFAEQIVAAIPSADEHGLSVCWDGQEIGFDSFDELANYSQLPNVISNFKIYSWDSKGRAIYFSASALFAEIRCYGEDRIWCSGTAVTLARMLAPCRRWFWITPWSMYATAAVSLFVLPFVMPSQGMHANSRFILWAPALLLAVLAFLRPRVFPRFKLVVRSEKSLLRRYRAGISFILGLMAAAAAIGKIFLPS